MVNMQGIIIHRQNTIHHARKQAGKVFMGIRILNIIWEEVYKYENYKGCCQIKEKTQ